MTAKQLLDATLIELNEKNAPSLPLQDYNYFINKAVNQYINKEYNIYDISQQTSDNLRVLKDTAILNAKKIENKYGSLDISKYITGSLNLFGATYEVELPIDYLHMLNCICIYRLNKRHKCWDKDNYVQFPAKRLTSDSWSKIINDFFQRPLPERPYYYIHNLGNNSNYPYNSETDMIGKYEVKPGINDSSVLAGIPEKKENNSSSIKKSVVIEWTGITFSIKDPSVIPGLSITSSGNDNFIINGKIGDINSFGTIVLKDSNDLEIDAGISRGNIAGTIKKTKIIDPNTLFELVFTVSNTNTNFDRVITLESENSPDKISTVERETAYRYGNPSKIRCEIRYGKDDSVFKLEKVFIDYIKTPQTIRLTQEQVDLTEDTSQILEFPDYVCQEIINELVKLIMENSTDQRLQTYAAVTQSIANPTQQQTQQPQSKG